MEAMKKSIKATISNLIVALIYTVVIVLLIYVIFGNQISVAMALINTISIDKTQKVVEETKLDLNNMKLINYPEYGTQYGRLKIESIDVDLPLYFGDTLSILKKGIGHSSGSYFPGEGGSILCAGHNYRGYIHDLYKTKNGDIITIETNYGTFNYEIYDSQIIKETELDKVPIQKEKEILMLYTCHPLDAIGHPTERLVVYANLVE